VGKYISLLQEIFEIVFEVGGSCAWYCPS